MYRTWELRWNWWLNLSIHRPTFVIGFNLSPHNLYVNVFGSYVEFDKAVALF